MTENWKTNEPNLSKNFNSLILHFDRRRFTKKNDYKLDKIVRNSHYRYFSKILMVLVLFEFEISASMRLIYHYFAVTLKRQLLSDQIRNGRIINHFVEFDCASSWKGNFEFKNWRTNFYKKRYFVNRKCFQINSVVELILQYNKFSNFVSQQRGENALFEKSLE